MRAYLSGERKHDVMRQAIMGLDVTQRMELANYYGILETPWSGGSDPHAINYRKTQYQAPSRKSIDAGKAISRPCEGCHGQDGNSLTAGVPSLAGLQPAYFIPALKAYLSGAREGAAIMKNFKLSLSEPDILNLAAYYSSLLRNRSPLSEKLQKTVPSDALVPRCTGCHGANGNSIHPAMPSLAGQNATYLVKAMQTYRDGERSNEMMVKIAKGLSDEDIERNATYFATQTPVMLQATNGAGGKSQAYDPLGDGEKLAASCNACHGPQGNNPFTGAPRLAGLSAHYLTNAITAYRDGRRRHAEMQLLTEHLSDIEIEKISLYYASQTPEKAGGAIARADNKNGEALSSSCAGCHGKNGNSKDTKVPSLAGQSGEYLVAAIRSYRENGVRQQSDMTNAVKDLDESAIRSLAQYYAQLDPERSVFRKPESPQVMAERCNRCHGPDGGQPDPGKPRIARQRKSYIVSSLLAYKNGERANSMMQAMAKELWLVEMDAIAAYYATQ